MIGAFALLKPFAVLAAAAFVAGVLGYLALERPSRAAAGVEAQPAVASAPASDDWNLPKHI